MGYTHYSSVKKTANTENIKRTVYEMSLIVQSKLDLLAGWDGEGEPTIEKGVISFNGSDGDGCETFQFPPDMTDPYHLSRGKPAVFDFCKTRQRPYDIVVTACLAVAADVMGDDIKVSSDGYRSEWEAGVALACDVLQRKIENPIDE